jgi:hypothetical protein
MLSTAPLPAADLLKDSVKRVLFEPMKSAAPIMRDA